MTGRTRNRRAAAAAAALTTCTLLLAGCGIKRTGVVESGHAAGVKIPGDKNAAVLYFVSQDGDRLVPVPFQMGAGYTLAPTPLLRILLNGPSGPASAAGLTTALPTVPEDRTGSATVGAYSPHEGMTVNVPFAVAGLSELARDQLVCTIGVSGVRDTVSPVTIQGTDTALPSADCRTSQR